jgi:SHAQKYF class myb-like DNA-binding protein
MIQTKNENMNKQPPFLITKEKKNNFLTQGVNKSKISNNSLSNINIIKISSCNNLGSISKDKIDETIKLETNKLSSAEKGVQFNIGRWTIEEHKKFLKGIIEYGNNWKMIEQLIKTRSRSQARSHAQKYFVKVKNKIIREKKVFNVNNLLNYVFNCIKNFKGGQPLDAIQKKRTLNLLISNFQKFRKDEIESCNMVVNEIKSISSQKDGEKYTIFEKENGKNRVSNLFLEIKENNYSEINSDLEDKKNTEENKMEFCNKKRKNSWFTNKIFKINKVNKYKNSNNVNEINENSNKKVSGSSNINITNNYNNFISNNNINNNKYSNSNNKINISTNNNNKNSVISNNLKNNNDVTCFDINKINSSEPLFDFDLSIRENNIFCEDKYPKYNTLDSKKLFFNENELNDSFKNNFFEESILSLGEHLDENSLINKLCDLFD